jgi:hypothetical protein
MTKEEIKVRRNKVRQQAPFRGTKEEQPLLADFIKID